MNLSDAQISVFVYPHQLNFYTSSPSTHKQFLRVYNHYEVPVKFEASLNRASNYEVVERCIGAISPNHNDDIAIRHKCPLPISCPSEESLKIVLKDATTHRLIGQRLVPLRLITGEKEPQDREDAKLINSNPPKEPVVNAGIENWIMKVCLVTVCLILGCILLIVPTRCDPVEDSFIPTYLHIGVWPKLLISFILGLFLSVVIRPF